jgi:hypothetical protein
VVGKVVREGIEKLDYSLSQVTPNLFAYQHLFELVSA